MAKDISEMSEGELKAAVESVLQNPAVGAMLGNLQGEGDTPARVPSVSPEMLEKMPEMMRMLAPLVSGMAGGKHTSGGESGAGTDGKAGATKDSAARKRLLAALRPYLSEGRRETLDSILRVAEMSDLIGTVLPGGKEQ